MQKQKKAAQLVQHAKYAKTHRRAAVRKRLLTMVRSLTTGDKLQGRGATGWYQLRKRAAQRLRNLSGNKLVLLESGYRGDDFRHALKNLECGHVYWSSLRELVTGGYGSAGDKEFAKRTCPFCSPPRDLRRCGSVEAVQELVWHLSNGKLSFADKNALRGQGELYTFGCEVHGYLFEASFTAFWECCAKDVDLCGYCASERRP